jgi:hypothetical protein
VDSLPRRWLTEAQANRLHAKLVGLLSTEQRQDPNIHIPLIAPHEWLRDEAFDGWSYVDTSTNITYWLSSADAFAGIYGTGVLDEPEVSSEQGREIADWSEPPAAEGDSESKFKAFSRGVDVFPEDESKAYLFDLAVQCLNCLRDAECPRPEEVRKASKEEKLDIERVLCEAYQRGHALVDDVIGLGFYLDDDEVENRDLDNVSEASDPEGQAQQDEIQWQYGTGASGRRRAALDREKLAGVRFRICDLPECKDKIGSQWKGGTYDSLVKVAARQGPRPITAFYSADSLRDLACGRFGIAGVEYGRAAREVALSRGKKELRREWVHEVQCLECRRWRLVDSGLGDDELAHVRCGQRPDMMVTPQVLCGAPDQRLHHRRSCHKDCHQHLIWRAVRKTDRTTYLRA